MERIVDVFLAFLIDIFVGDPPFGLHPVRLMGRFISWGEKYYRRFTGNQKLNGFMLVVSLLFIVYLSVYFLFRIVGFYSLFFERCIDVVLIFASISVKDLACESLKVYKELQKGDISSARKYLSYIVSRQTEELDEEEIVRATVETVAENSVDGVISPLFYAFLGGAPLAILFKAVSTLDSMIGYKDEVYREFGWFAARLDDLANFFPARLTFLFLPLVAMFFGVSPSRVFRIMLRDRGKGTSPNAPIPEAGFATIIGITLGGINYYKGKKVRKPLLGENLKNKEKKDIITSLKVVYLLSLFSVLIMGAVFSLFKLTA